MLPICHVCLRTDKKLLTIDEGLEIWHDELCDFAIEVTIIQFCVECAHLLRKFYNYKEKCRLANKVLNKWLRQNEEERKPLNLLYKQIPYSPLRLANKNNCKVYFYQELDTTTLDLNTTCDLNITNELNPTYDLNETYDLLTPQKLNQNIVPLKELNSKYSHIITVDVTGAKDSEKHLKINENQPYVNKTIHVNGNQPSTSKVQPYRDIIHNHENKETIKIEDETTENLVYEELQIKNDIDDDIINEIYDSNSDVSQFEIKLVQEADLKSDSDSSDNEVLIKKKKQKTEDDTWINDLENQLKKTQSEVEKVKKVKRRRPFNIEMLKKLLLNRFASCGEVKDEEGNLIEKDCIINNLGNMHIYTLNQIKNRLKASQILTPEAIRVLSRVQKKYGDQYSSVFSVEHLPTLEDAIAEFNKRQSYEGYVSAEYKCDLCYRGFKHKKMYDYHFKTYHNLQLAHLCEICKMRFKNRHALLKHQNGHKEVFKCKLCPLITNYRTAMVNHYHQHKGMIYKCEFCINTFKSKSCLSAHMNYMHHSQHICSLCARTFASEAGLAQHKTRKHCDVAQSESAETTEKSKTCDQCDITFVTERVYMKHMERSHGQELPPLYKRRVRSAARQKPNFVCRVCNTVEHSFGRLTFHFNQQHPNENFEMAYSDRYKHLCHICGKGYASITDLNEHKHLHTGAKPYACDQCPKSFHRKINLRNHLERHRPPARECPTCGKKFVSAANLSNHIKLHIGIRHYTCEICAKSFLHRSSLNAHVRGVHHHVRRQRKQPKPADSASL